MHTWTRHDVTKEKESTVIKGNEKKKKKKVTTFIRIKCNGDKQQQS